MKSIFALCILGLSNCSAPPKQVSEGQAGAPTEAKPNLTETQDLCRRFQDQTYEEVFGEKVYFSQVPGIAGDPRNAANCGVIEYCRNVIYAEAGYAFRSEKWRGTFEKTSWYKPDPSFAKDKLSAVAVKNLEILKQQETMCSASPLETQSISGNAIEIAADLDEDGAMETVKVTRTSIAIGSHEESIYPQFDASAPDRHEYVAVVDVDTSEPGKEVMLAYGWPGESTATLLFFSYDKKEGLLKTSEAITRTSFRLPGDGTKISSYPLCGEFFWSVDGLDAGVWVNKSQTSVGVPHKSCFSRPAVYVDRDGERVRLGEILASLQSTNMRQKRGAVAIPSRFKAATRFVLTEDNAETTYLDEIYLETENGEKVFPLQCRDAPMPMFCHTDGQYLELQQHEELQLDFPNGERARLVANGYYLDTKGKDEDGEDD